MENVPQDAAVNFIRIEFYNKYNGTFMYAKHGNIVNADASGAKASTKHLESRLEAIQGHAILGSLKSRRWPTAGLYNNVDFRFGNFEGKV